MTRKLVVTGLGATTPLGGDVQTTWRALLAGESGITTLEQEWVARHGLPVTFAGQAKVSAKDVLSVPETKRLDPSSQFALIAAREAWADAGTPDVDPERLAVEFATGIGGVWTLLDAYDNLNANGPRRVLPMTVPMLMPNGPAAAIGMEPPINAHADAIRDEKLKVLRALKPWTRESLQHHVVRGQYAAGSINGAAVPAYADEPGVAPGSQTETFVALRAEIANWRWAGVPFYIRTGKRLAARDARIVVNFRPTPHAIFSTPAGAANRLVINLQPKDGLELHLLAQGADKRLEGGQRSTAQLAPVQLDLDFDKRFGSERVGAYERLLLDVIEGRLNLFVRSDEQEEAWRWVEPILDSWRHDSQGPRPYAAGTWGPEAATSLLARDGRHWIEPTGTSGDVK